MLVSGYMGLIKDRFREIISGWTNRDPLGDEAQIHFAAIRITANASSVNGKVVEGIVPDTAAGRVAFMYMIQGFGSVRGSEPELVMVRETPDSPWTIFGQDKRGRIRILRGIGVDVKLTRPEVDVLTTTRNAFANRLVAA
jgi:hypothetical protein